MSRERKGRRNAHGRWAVRILAGLLLFWAGVLWAELPGSAWNQGKEQMEGPARIHTQIAAAGQPEGNYTGQRSLEQQGSADLNAAAEVMEYYANPDTEYRIYIEDRAELLTEDQRRELFQAMQRITAYGNAAFLTTDRNAASTESLARSYYMERFGTDSGTVFVIDMDNRNIWIHSDGAVYKVITSAYADTVTDNVYRYASDGDYYGCAREAFAEIYALLEGQRIAQPMKYISNALLAMILALLANFGLVICLTRLRRPGEDALLANISRRFRFTKPDAVYTHQTKTYDPVSSGGSGGSGGSSGGGSGGGGGSSGGGGGHSF